MNKVYLVWLTAGRSYSATLVNVFSTRKGAKAFIAEHGADLGKSLSIQELPVITAYDPDASPTE